MGSVLPMAALPPVPHTEAALHAAAAESTGTGHADIPVAAGNAAASAGLAGGVWDLDFGTDPGAAAGAFPWAIPEINADFLTASGLPTGASYSYDLPHVQFVDTAIETSAQLQLLPHTPTTG